MMKECLIQKADSSEGGKKPIELARERKKEHNIFLKTSSLVAAASMYAYNPSGAIMDMLTESHSDYEINGHILDIN